MSATKKALDATFFGDAYRHIFSMARGLRLGGGAMSKKQIDPKAIAQEAAEREQAFGELVKINGCNSEGLMRFQKNLKRYAMKQPFGIFGDGSIAPPMPIPAHGTTFEYPGYIELIEDLIIGEVRASWKFNKFELKSTANAKILPRDTVGRPLDASPTYRSAGMNGLQTGTVKVTFADGHPVCLYFWDNPNSCRIPNKLVVPKYVHGLFSPQAIAAKNFQPVYP